MGTRHLIKVVKDGEEKVSQYGQWDGYPDGQGATVLGFLHSVFQRERFEKNLDACPRLTDVELQELWEDAGARPDALGVPMDIYDKFKGEHPSLTRDAGAQILVHIQADPVPLKLDTEFHLDSLMCEWTYVVDLDLDTFEVYQGFNLDPLPETERFFDPTAEDRRLEQLAEDKKRMKENPKAYAREFYYPIRHVRTWSLNSLPDHQQFLMQVNIIGCRYQEELDDLTERWGENMVRFWRQDRWNPFPLKE